MVLRLVFCCLLAVICSPADPSQAWICFRSTHFEVFVEAASEDTARATLNWLEQVHSFFALETGFGLDGEKRIRVISFRSREEYGRYRPASAADAYFAAAGGETYIVFPGAGGQRFGVIAHEYAHVALHGSRTELPPWLNEGLAEVYSTLHFTQHGTTLGGPIETHVHTLRAHSGMTVEQLLGTKQERFRDDRDFAVSFYAHAWALAEMLMFSPPYASGFRDFVKAVASGIPDRKALATVYGKDLRAVDGDLRARVERGAYDPVTMLFSGRVQAGISSSEQLSQIDSRLLLAGLLVAIGEYGRAAAEYRDLAKLQPENASVAAAFGALALREHDFETARREWKRALDSGVSDPILCYQYAMLADSVNMPAEEVRSALRRAISLKPDFDDARWKLALLANNAGQFEESAAQLRAMTRVMPSRGFAYWSALSYAEDEIGKHDGAVEAANTAASFATTDTERARARELVYIAQTELTVRFATDGNGRRQMVTSRMPRGISGWNPFIEPNDRMRSVEGKLSDVRCTDGRLTGIVVGGASDSAQLAVNDPQQVLIGNGPSEFMCGPQTDTRTVVVEYAAQPEGSVAGIVRGIRFK